MANYSAKILGNAISGIRAQQGVIATIGNNIANVNTSGYSRRTAALETRVQTGQAQAGITVGNGVDLGSIQRQVDDFIETQLQTAKGESASAEIINSFLGRAEELFSLTGDSQTIGSSLTEFFDAASDLALNPSSLELRSTFIEATQTLVTSIKNTYNGLASLQSEADARLANEVVTVNSLTQEIADLNQRIASFEAGGVTANDERDRRTELLGQLAEKISFSTIEVSNGSINVTLENGFALVSGGISRDLSFERSPSFATTVAQSLSGGQLGYIVYDYSNGAGTQHVDFTNFLKNQTGTIGGLLQVRGYGDPAETQVSAFNADGHLVEIASRVEAITNRLLTSINGAYLGADRSSGTAGHQASSGDLNGAVPAVYGLFDFDFTGLSGSKDANANLYPDDLNYNTVGNYSSRLQLAFTDPTRVAAALDQTPLAASPTFVVGDGRNMANLAALRTQTYTFSIGNVSLAGVTFDQAYQETVTSVSNRRLQAESDVSVTAANVTSAQNRRDSISGVSLDEEFTSLITAQKAFEASARMIKTAQTLLDELLNII